MKVENFHVRFEETKEEDADVAHEEGEEEVPEEEGGEEAKKRPRTA